jgi:hypothetical protein
MAYHVDPAQHIQIQNGAQASESVPSQPIQKPRRELKRVIVPALTKPLSCSNKREVQQATAKPPAAECAARSPEDEYPAWLDETSEEDADIYEDDHHWSQTAPERASLDEGKRKNRPKRRSYDKMSKAGYYEVGNLLALSPTEWIEGQRL